MVTRAALIGRTKIRKTQMFSQGQHLSSAGDEKHKARVSIPQPRVRSRISEGALFPNNLLPVTGEPHRCWKQVLQPDPSSGSEPQSTEAQGLP